MLLAVVSAWCAHRRVAPPAGLDKRWAPAICWVLAGISFWAASTRIGLPRDPVGHTAAEILGTQLLFGLTAFFLLIPGIFGPQDRGIIRGFLRNPVVQWIGLVSYGVYLWHEAWINKYLDWFDKLLFSTSVPGMVLFVVALTLVSAAVSYSVLERPLLRRKTGTVSRRAARTS
jgi:peptidoglycan/LPS O-acetylase OafA/YrhL